MKIALVLSAPPGYSETFFRSKIKGLQENGHQVILVTAKTQTKFDLCAHKTHPKVYANSLQQIFSMLWVGISLLPYFAKVKTYYQLERQEKTPLKRIVEKMYINATLLKLDLDWLHFGFATMAIDRELVAESIGAKMAVSFRGYDIGIYPLKHSHCYNKLWKFVDKIHYISNDLYEKALKLGLSKQVPSEKITPAIDLKVFNDLNNKKFSKNNPVIFLTIGRLHWKKGLPETLKALKILDDLGINFIYKIAGTGEEQESIAYIAFSYGILDKVEFLGQLNTKEILEKLKESDIYLQYSTQEGFCNAVLEAQAMGKLCIVSDAEGLSENISNNYSGWVVPKLQPLMLAQKIQEVIHLETKKKQKISQQAQERVKNSFSLSQQKQCFNQFYN